MNKLPMKIIGMGSYLPERIVTNDEVERIAGLPEGYIDGTSAGVKERRWVGTEEQSSWMGAQAAREALGNAGLQIEDIDMIINASGSQEQSIPDGGPLIQRHLGMENSGIPCMSVHVTCLSFLMALNVAANFVTTGQYEKILIVSSEISSRAINPKETESFVLFGDVAAAAVVAKADAGESSGMNGFIFRTWGTGAFYTAVMGGGTHRHPNMPTTNPEDNLFTMKGYRVFKLAAKHTGETMEMLRPGLSKGLGSIKRVIPHQASGMAIQALQWLNWPLDKVEKTVHKFGNCIAASIPITLYEAIKSGRVERGDELLLMGTGAGLSIGGMILTY